MKWQPVDSSDIHRAPNDLFWLEHSEKLGRLCTSTLGAHAYCAANAVDMFETVKVHVASRRSATLDILMEKTMTRHGRSLLTSDAEACKVRSRTDLHDWRSRSRDHTRHKLDTIAGPTICSSWHKSGPRQAQDSGPPASCGPTQPRTMSDNNGASERGKRTPSKHIEFCAMPPKLQWLHVQPYESLDPPALTDVT